MHQTFLTVDLGFGDAGKGSIVDYLTRVYEAHTVVRYNGGAQAAHRVVTGGAHPQEHVFAQFGSGTLAGAATHLSRFMLLDPLAMREEARHLEALGIDACARTTIDEHAPVISPFSRAINRLNEVARGDGRHGSCGMGIGETMSDYINYGERVVLAGDLRDADALHAKLHFVREMNLAKLHALEPTLPDNPQVAHELEFLTDPDLDWIIDAYRDLAKRMQIVAGDYLHAILKQPGTVIFEGAQGVLLDEWHGFHPHTTWSTTTLENAHTLLAEASYSGHTTRLGITRAYTTRHGAGPLATEDAALTRALPDACNSYGDWQRGFRVGWLDLVLLRYALDVVGPLDALAITCLDRLADLPSIKVCRCYQYDTFTVDRIAPSPTPDLSYQEQITRNLSRCQPLLETVPNTDALLQLIVAESGVPIGLTSYGPTADDKYVPET